MAVAVHRKLDHLVAPGGDALVVDRNVLHAFGVAVFFRDRRKIVVEVTNPQRPVKQYVVSVLFCLKRDHDPLKQISERHMHHVDFGTGQLFKLFGMQRRRLPHDRDGMSNDVECAPGVILGVDGFKGTGPRHIRLDTVLGVVGRLDPETARAQQNDQN